MTKIDIVTDLYEKLGFSKRECAHIVDRFFEIIKDTLAADENVKDFRIREFLCEKEKGTTGKKPANRSGNQDYREKSPQFQVEPGP